LIFHNSFVARLWPVCGALSQKTENGSVTVLLLIWFIDTIAGNTSSDNQEQLPVSYLGDNEGLNLFKRNAIRKLSWMLSILLVFQFMSKMKKRWRSEVLKSLEGIAAKKIIWEKDSSKTILIPPDRLRWETTWVVY